MPLLRSVFLLALIAAAPALADEAPRGALLLRNGEVFQGGLLLENAEFRVLLPHGEVRFPVAEVECTAPTVREIYLRQQAMVIAGDARERLRLAQWCIRQGLLDEAEAELAAARSVDPGNPATELLAHRLVLARQPRASVKPLAVPPGVQAAAHLEELDRLARALPPGAVETFTQQVQPMMMNSCATAACHGPQSASELHLLRVPGTRPASRRLTQRNLHSVLSWIDRDQPNSSALLKRAAAAHGSARAAPMPPESAQYQRLMQWVYQVARAEHRLPAADPQVVAAGATAPAEEGKVQPAVVQAAFSAPESAPAAEPPAHADAAPAEPPVGADPFDPEIFNRRFLKD